MSGRILGVEIGGTKLQLAAGMSSGEVLATHRGAAPAEDGAQGILDWLAREVPAFLERQEDVERIGVGFGGPVDTAVGTVLVSHQVSGWDGLPLVQWFEKRFGLPTTLANDSNAAGWAEYRLGAGQGSQTFCYMNIGSGIGGAVVIGGRLHNGQGFGAGEFGHTYVPDWTAKEPGVAQKAELLCSGWSIERRLREGPAPEKGTPLDTLSGGSPESITCAMLAEAARQGDARALGEIDRVAGALGTVLANAIAICHPERIALGGGVALMGDVLLEPVRRYVRERAFGPFRDSVTIVPCALGESVVPIGAMLLAADDGEATE